MKEYLLAGSTWIRGIFMLVFVLFFYYIGIYVIAVFILAQFGFLLFTGRLNEHLLNLGQTLSIYLYQLMLYLTYNSDDKPFPFKQWPSSNELSKNYLSQVSEVSKDSISVKDSLSS